MELDREILDLEKKLAEVGAWEARLKELDRQLGASTVVNNKVKRGVDVV